MNYLIIQYGVDSYKSYYYPYLYAFEYVATYANLFKIADYGVGLYRSHNKKLFVTKCS